MKVGAIPHCMGIAFFSDSHIWFPPMQFEKDDTCCYDEKGDGDELCNRKFEPPYIISGIAAFTEKSDGHHGKVSGRRNHPEIPALGQKSDEDHEENQKAAPYQEKYIDHSFS